MMDDAQARARALDTSFSFVVQAPAGSGKTELLIQRFLKLLATVENPESVVAITFTRKAAGEMRARVLEALLNAQSGLTPDREHERNTFEIARGALQQDQRRGWNLTQNPAQIRIETIDALCASITRRMPWLARFGAMPEIVERAEALYRQAARNTLQHAEQGDEALASMLFHLDDDFHMAERLLVEMLEKRDQWLRHTAGASVREELERALARLVGNQLQQLSAAFSPSAAAEIAQLLQFEQFPQARPEDLPLWIQISDLLLTKDGKWRKRFDRGPRQQELIETLMSNEQLRELLRTARKLPSPRFSDSQWQAMQAMVAVLKLAVAELHLVFRENGSVDFAELAIRASEALGRLDSPSDLALALGHELRHLLVDEFQDTSFTQFDLIEKLTAGWEPGDGRTLFLVGDPMQSIYRFREADVSLFLKARREGLGSICLEPLTLSRNFRSRPELVDWFNRSFREVLPPENDIDSGAISYSPSISGVEQDGGTVEIHAVEDAEAEADRVLALTGRSNEGTTAILVRARAHLAAIVTRLHQNRIPFQAIEIDELGERPVIQDLMALTFALLHPGDRVSWLAILRAPWCGLSLADLHALSSANPHAAVWDLLHKGASTLSEDGSARIGRVLPLLESALAERGRRPLRECVESVWLLLGGPACTDDTGMKDAGAYFELLETMERGADLDDFGWFREQVSLLFAETDVHADGRLQIMTIHKAKGLEFDTVILPGLGERAATDPQRLLIWLEQGGELLLAPVKQSGSEPDPIYDCLDRLERRKAEHESARLLYVAATRARRNLHLLGCAKRKEDGSLSEPKGGSFLRLLWPIAAKVFDKLDHAVAVEPPPKPRVTRRVAPGWSVPEPPLSVNPPQERIEILEPPRVTFEWAGERLRFAGTALHGFLQQIAREGLAAWDDEKVRAYRAQIRSILENLGVVSEDLRDCCERVEAGLLSTLRDPRGRWILHPHSDAASELPLAGMIDGKLIEVVMDRSFIDEQGVRWIIDYKTGEHTGGDLEAFLDNEQSRYREQLERYARLMFQQDHRPIRLGLYFPMLGGWREWPAPVVVRRQASLFER